MDGKNVSKKVAAIIPVALCGTTSLLAFTRWNERRILCKFIDKEIKRELSLYQKDNINSSKKLDDKNLNSDSTSQKRKIGEWSVEKAYSVCIIQNADQRVKGVYLKEFFMFAGIYVNEKVDGIDSLDFLANREIQEVDLYLDLRNKKVEDQKSQFDGLNYINIPVDKENFELNTKEKRSEFGKDIFEQLWKKLSEHIQDKVWIAALHSLSDIFIENDYAYKHYFSHLYLKQMADEEDKMDDLVDFYLKCLKEIDNVRSRYTDNLNLEFAYLNCARKINRIDICCNRQTLFNERKVMEKAAELSEKDPSFSIGNVLAGQVGFSRNILWDEGISYLSKALKKEKNKEYCEFILYCIGHFCEVEKNKIDIAEEFYRHIEKLNPNNFRANFKLGWIAHIKRDHAGAKQYFEKVYDGIKKKQDDNLIEPLEIEYFYKCGYMLGEDVTEDLMGEAFEKSSFINRFFFCKEQVEYDEKRKYKQYFMKKIERHRDYFIE